MSYNVSLTNGVALVTIPDTTADITTTSINLVGRNYSGYGILLNENFVKLLEHFSSANAPANPLVGQLWWDSVNKHLNVWQGSNWKVISSSQTGATAPSNPVTGDFWWNTTSSTLSVYSGSTWISVGPTTPPGVALTTLIQNTLTDNVSTPHIVGNIMVNNRLTGIISTDSGSFTPASSITGIPIVNPGLNLSSGLTVTGNSSLANITVTGNTSLTNVTVNGATAFAGNVSFTGNVALPSSSNIFSNIAGNVVPSANLTYNLGSPTAYWNNVYGTAIHAQYADLAERFEADMAYEPGTVVEIGGPAEITQVGADLSEEVFGVISTNAAYLMNSGAGTNSTHPPIAVQGRVPVKVIGTISKGDRLVSAGNGMARAGKKSEITTWNVIGRALEDKKTKGTGVIEAVVKLNS